MAADSTEPVETPAETPSQPVSAMPIPIVCASILADQYEKSWVVIAAFDNVDERYHVTSYGRSVEAKVMSACVADELMAVISNTTKKRGISDFRHDFDAAHYRLLQERIRQLLDVYDADLVDRPPQLGAAVAALRAAMAEAPAQA